MDGNGRWAKSKHLPRLEGHRQGAKSVRMVVEEACRLGIRYLTVYAFSTENWGRPGDEVSGLMKLFQMYLENELSLFVEHDVRLRAIGDRERLPAAVKLALQNAEEKTKNARRMDFIIAISYGGREEIMNAARMYAEDVKAGKAETSELNEKNFSEYLYAPDVPDVDLLIRTSDEYRISNFLLWQAAYAEIVVTPTFWPDFSPEEFERCLYEYSTRQRRFGLTGDQSTVNGEAACAASTVSS